MSSSAWWLVEGGTNQRQVVKKTNNQSKVAEMACEPTTDYTLLVFDIIWFNMVQIVSIQKSDKIGDMEDT